MEAVLDAINKRPYPTAMPGIEAAARRLIDSWDATPPASVARQADWQPKVGDRVRVFRGRMGIGIIGVVCDVFPGMQATLECESGTSGGRWRGGSHFSCSFDCLELADQPHLVPVRRGGPWKYGGKAWTCWRNGKHVNGTEKAYRVHGGHLECLFQEGWWLSSSDQHGLHGIELRAPKGYDGPLPEGCRWLDQPAGLKAPEGVTLRYVSAEEYKRHGAGVTPEKDKWSISRDGYGNDGHWHGSFTPLSSAEGSCMTNCQRKLLDGRAKPGETWLVCPPVASPLHPKGGVK